MDPVPVPVEADPEPVEPVGMTTPTRRPYVRRNQASSGN